MAVGQVLRGMQRTGGEGWTAVPLVCGCVHGEGAAGVLLRVCAALCRVQRCCTPLLEQACVFGA